MAHLQARMQAHDLEAFCAICPTPQEVTSVLQAIGFTLTFHMDAVPSACAEVPPLPAQYHYCDQLHGSEVIFLAGCDAGPRRSSAPRACIALLALCRRRCRSGAVGGPCAGCQVVSHLALSVAGTSGCRVEGGRGESKQRREGAFVVFLAHPGCRCIPGELTNTSRASRIAGYFYNERASGMDKPTMPTTQIGGYLWQNNKQQPRPRNRAAVVPPSCAWFWA